MNRQAVNCPFFAILLKHTTPKTAPGRVDFLGMKLYHEQGYFFLIQLSHIIHREVFQLSQTLTRKLLPLLLALVMMVLPLAAAMAVEATPTDLKTVLNINWTIPADKEYDGNTTATVKSSGILSGVAAGDDVSIKAGTASFPTGI